MLSLRSNVALGLAAAVGLGAVLVRPPATNTAAVELADSAKLFVDILTPEQRAKAMLPFEGDERRAWNFVPREYAGVLLGDLALPARRAAHMLLSRALSNAGYLKVTAIMALEGVLRQLEETGGRQAPHRDPERYWFAVFGDPAQKAPWGMRVQGHHVSLNFSVDAASGSVAATPWFVGANPHEVRVGAKAGSRVLGEMEDLAFALLGALDADQRAAASLDARPPADVILGPTRAADFLGAPRGVAWASLTAAQAELLQRLIGACVNDLRPDLARRELDAIAAADKAHVCFAWLGATERGKPHYFRVHGPAFAIEYDNVQNEANHVHVVWRQVGRDFGADWLAAHHAAEHGRGK